MQTFNLNVRIHQPNFYWSRMYVVLDEKEIKRERERAKMHAQIHAGIIDVNSGQRQNYTNIEEFISF